MKRLSEISIQDALDHLQQHCEKMEGKYFEAEKKPKFVTEFDHFIAEYNINQTILKSFGSGKNPELCQEILDGCLFLMIKYRLGLPKKGAN